MTTPSEDHFRLDGKVAVVTGGSPRASGGVDGDRLFA